MLATLKKSLRFFAFHRGNPLSLPCGEKGATLEKLPQIADKNFNQVAVLAVVGLVHVLWSLLGDGAVFNGNLVDSDGYARLVADYVDEGETLLGTGGAVRQAVDQAEATLDEGFLVLYGDSYLSINVGAVWAASGGGVHSLMCVLRNKGRWDASNAVFKGGLVTVF